MSDVTRILSKIESGDQQASEELLPLVYEELRKLAAARMARERDDHTLPPTALVHEAYLRLIGTGEEAWEGRGHFFAAAAEAMRRVLVDHARNAKRRKRGGNAQQLSLDAIDLAWNPQYGDVLDLSEALDRLAKVAPQTAEIVKLRCFAGQSFSEAATILGISLRTAKRRWAFARAWLYQAIQGEPSKQDPIEGSSLPNN